MLLGKHHEYAQYYEVVMMMAIVVVVKMMSGSPKPEEGYIWVYINAMLARYQGKLGHSGVPPDAFLFK